ncbi:hypothetical protein [Marinicella meishanensis]|uniref:hypothetical protein n=1 Tax=Marinicella meishanensis TaxID=2873263 RepID=UPI001CBEF0FC|nr:hypothetical protein [Marinicella sp. NBU2979]
MKTMILLTGLAALTFTTGCHAHKADHNTDRVVVVKKPHQTKVILVDNDHRRKNYTIVRVKPAKNRVCKKHRQHWHCI